MRATAVTYRASPHSAWSVSRLCFGTADVVRSLLWSAVGLGWWEASRWQRSVFRTVSSIDAIAGGCERYGGWACSGTACTMAGRFGADLDMPCV